MFEHKSVLLKETIKALKPKPEGIYLDATLGLGGHSEELAKYLTTGKIIAFDLDEDALIIAKKRLKDYQNIIFIHDNFKNLKKHLQKLKIEKIDGAIYDLGASTLQFKKEDRGFSYHGEQVLDMRMNQKQALTAKKLLNNYSEKDLIRIFRNYGDEKRAALLAKKIIEYRHFQPIETNYQLNAIIKNVKGFNKKKHPSKNIYQAIRIEVNNEIINLQNALNDTFEFLKSDARIVVITFHSLEDRVVKEIFWKKKQEKIWSIYQTENCYQTFKSIYSSKAEIAKNKSAKSAKLRIIQKQNVKSVINRN